MHTRVFLFLDDMYPTGANPVLVAGGGEESIMQPTWSPDNSSLFFISDRTDYWNLYMYNINTGSTTAVLPVESGTC
jgi:Tol biopolymer transport system component